MGLVLGGIHTTRGGRYCEVIALYCYCDGGTLTENIREILSCCLGWIGGHTAGLIKSPYYTPSQQISIRIFQP